MEVHESELIFMCSIIQPANLQVSRSWSVLFLLLTKSTCAAPACTSAFKASFKGLPPSPIFVCIFPKELGAFSMRKLPLSCPKILQKGHIQHGIPPAHAAVEARSPPARHSHLLDLSPSLFCHLPHYTAFISFIWDCRLLESRGSLFSIFQAPKSGNKTLQKSSGVSSSHCAQDGKI